MHTPHAHIRTYAIHTGTMMCLHTQTLKCVHAYTDTQTHWHSYTLARMHRQADTYVNHSTCACAAQSVLLLQVMCRQLERSWSQPRAQTRLCLLLFEPCRWIAGGSQAVLASQGLPQCGRPCLVIALVPKVMTALRPYASGSPAWKELEAIGSLDDGLQGLPS